MDKENENRIRLKGGLLELFRWEQRSYLSIGFVGLGLIIMGATIWVLTVDNPTIPILLLSGAGFLMFSIGRLRDLREQVDRLVMNETIRQEDD